MTGSPPHHAQGNSDASELELPNDRAAIDRIENSVTDALERYGYPKAARFAVRLAIEEAIANAFHHGHSTLPPETPIHVGYRVGPDEVHFTVRDQGPGFDPSTIADPTLDENLEVPSGRGLMLIRAYMTSVSFNDRGNQMHMIYKRDANP